MSCSTGTGLGSKTDYQSELGGMSGTGDDSYLDVDIKTVASTMFFEYPLGEFVESSNTLASRSQNGLRNSGTGIHHPHQSEGLALSLA